MAGRRQLPLLTRTPLAKPLSHSLSGLGFIETPGGTGRGRRETPFIDKDADDIRAEGSLQGHQGNDGLRSLTM